MICDTDTHIIKKIITASGDVYPESVYNNPLLDKTVTRALSKSLVNILKQSPENSNFNSSLRHFLLTYIRSLCQVEPKEHCHVDDNIIGFITESYIQHLENKAQNSTEQCLDTFLIKEMKSVNINSISNPKNPIDAEVIQALINLNEYGTNMESVYENILHWNVSDKNMKLLKKLWNEDSMTKDCMLDSLCIKIKSEIENILLDICHKILVQQNMDVQDIFENENLHKLIKNCLKSAHCFQICYGILNSIFISTHLNPQICSLIYEFIKNIKNSYSNTISSLYHNHLKHIVTILDIDIAVLPGQLRDKYIKSAVIYLIQLKDKCEEDVIMLLSHYPQWFDIYMDQILVNIS